MDTIEATGDSLRAMDIGKVFKDNQADINSLCFSDDSTMLVTSSDDDSVNIYNILRGTREKCLFNREFGVDNIRLTHHNNAFLCSTKKGKDSLIKYWSSYDNRIIHNFRGHTDSISSICMNPVNDTFLSAGRDKRLAYWDLRLRKCCGYCEYTEGIGAGSVAYDPSGLIFALVYPVSNQSSVRNVIKLFDCSQYQNGPYESWEFDCPEIKGLEFSDDGNLLLAYTIENQILLLDAMMGTQKCVVRDFVNENGKVMASFSPCSKFLVTGCERNNGLVIFDAASGQRVHELKGHPKLPTCVAWNKEYMLMASACQNLVFWVPDLNKTR